MTVDFREPCVAIAEYVHRSAALGLAWNRLNEQHSVLWRRSYLALGELGRRPVGFEQQRGGA